MLFHAALLCKVGFFRPSHTLFVTAGKPIAVWSCQVCTHTTKGRKRDLFFRTLYVFPSCDKGISALLMVFLFFYTTAAEFEEGLDQGCQAWLPLARLVHCFFSVIQMTSTQSHVISHKNSSRCSRGGLSSKDPPSLQPRGSVADTCVFGGCFSPSDLSTLAAVVVYRLQARALVRWVAWPIDLLIRRHAPNDT